MSSADDDKIRIRIAEIMSSAGLGYNRISLEILYLLPREFVDRYIELWEKAMGPAIRSPGEGMARDGELGRAQTVTKNKGLMPGAGSGGSAKRWKRVFVVRDEKALELKTRVDKRLRNMAREMRIYVGSLDTEVTSTSMGVKQCLGRGKETSKKIGKTGQVSDMMASERPGCGRIYPDSYNFCPFDGKVLKSNEGSKDSSMTE